MDTVALNAMSALPDSGRGAPAQSAALVVLTAVPRRHIHGTDATTDEPTQTARESTTDVAAAPLAALTATTITISTWSQLVSDVAAYGGYISPPTAGTWSSDNQATLEDTSWTLNNTYLDAFGGLDQQTDSYATQTTFTYTTPYAQNAFVQSQLKNKALELQLNYAPSNYTAWLVATSLTDSSTISGGKQLAIGDTIVHPAPIYALTPDGNGGFTLAFPATTDPSWQSVYYVAILPKNIVPVFPGGDITAPTAPTIATSKLTPSSVSLKTSGSTDDVGVVGYNFYRVDSYDDGQGNTQTTIFKANGSVVSTGTTFVDTAVEPNTTYVYTARAVDAAGHESLDSAPLSVTTPALDTEPPTAPGITATDVTTMTVTLLVSGSTDNVKVVGYDIYRDGVQVNVEAVKVGESFLDTDLLSGTAYTYTAQAFDAAGNYSEESAPLLVTTNGSAGGDTGDGDGTDDGDELTAPKIRTTDVTTTAVYLHVEGDKTEGIVSYEIYRRVAGGSEVLITSVVGADGDYKDTGLTPDTSYYYTARAVDSTGKFSAKSEPPLLVTTNVDTSNPGHSGHWWDKLKISVKTGVLAFKTLGSIIKGATWATTKFVLKVAEPFATATVGTVAAVVTIGVLAIDDARLLWALYKGDEAAAIAASNRIFADFGIPASWAAEARKLYAKFDRLAQELRNGALDQARATIAEINQLREQRSQL